MSAVQPGTEARRALSRALMQAAPGPVAWAGPGGAAHYRSAGRVHKSLERIASWAEDEVDLLHLALGWRAGLRSLDDEGPLTVVVEDLPPALMEALERARGEDLVVVLLDSARRYVAGSRSMFGRGGGSAAIYGEARGFPFPPPLEAERSDRLVRALDAAVSERGVRFLHVLGPEVPEASGERPRRSEGWLASAPAGWPGPVDSAPTQARGLGAADSLETQVLARLAADLEGLREVVLFWTRSGPPGPLALLGRRLRRASVKGVLLEAAGSAAAGAHPVVAVSAPRVPLLLPELLEMAVFPLTLLVLGGGLAPMAGTEEPHPAGMRDLSFLRSLAGATVAVPADEEEARGVLRALLALPGPGVLRLASSPAVGVPDADEARVLPPGTGRRLRSGEHLSLACLGSTVFPAVLASEALRSWGVEAGVYDFRYLEPLDEDLLAEAAGCGRLITVEEHALHGGLGSAVLEALARQGRQGVTVQNLGIRPEVADCSPDAHGLTAEGIAEAGRRILGLGTVE